MKKFNKVLCFFLCLSMIVPTFIFPSFAEESGTVLIDEDFESTNEGGLPTGWSGNTNANLTATVESSTIEMTAEANNALYVSHFEKNIGAIIASHDFTRSQKAHISFDYQMGSITAPTASRPNGGSNGVTFYSYNDGYTDDNKTYYRIVVLYVSETEGRFAYMDANGEYRDILDADGNQVIVTKGDWYHVDVTVDSTFSDKTVVSYKIDNYGKVLAEGSFDHTKLGDPNRVVFHCMANSEINDSFYVDNVSISAGSYKHNDDFETTNIGAIPTGFVKGGSGEVKVVEKALNNNKGLYIAKKFYTGGAAQLIYQSYTNLSQDLALENSASLSFDYQYEWLTPKGTYIAPNGTEKTAKIEGLNSATFYSINANGANATYYRIGVSRVDDDKAELIGYKGSGSNFNILNNGEKVYIYRDKLYHFDVSYNKVGTAYPVISYKVTDGDTVVAEGEFACTTNYGINKIVLQTTGSDSLYDEFYIDNLKLTCGDTVVEENFENFALEQENPVIANISHIGNNGSIVVKSRPIKEVKKEYYTTKALYVTDTDDKTGPIIVSKGFDGISDVVLDFDYMLATDASYAANGFAVGGGGTATANLRVLLKVFPNADGVTSTLKYYDGKAYVATSKTDIVPFRWYNIRIEIDDSSSTAAIYVDGVKVADAYSRKTVERVDRVVFQSHNAAGMGDKFFIDNVKLTTPTIFADAPVGYVDNFDGAEIPADYSFSGTGSNALADGALALAGEIRATRVSSYTKSGKFSFSVKTDNPDGLYFGLSDGTDDIYKINIDSKGRAFYTRGNTKNGDFYEVAVSTKEIIKANEWVNVVIDLPHDRNAPYAYLYVEENGELLMRGHVLYKALATYVNGLYIGAEEGTTLYIDNVKCEDSDGVIKIPERTEDTPVIYLPEVVKSQVLYLENDSAPKSSTLSTVGTTDIIVDKNYTSIGVDLGVSQKINALRFTTAATEKIDVNYRRFTLYTSDDNKNWEKFGGVTANYFEENGKWIMLFEFSGVEARFVKINFLGSASTGITITSPADNVRAERRIERQWKMAGQNMVGFGDLAPEHTALLRLFEDEGMTFATGDSIGLNYGLASPVEAVELVAYGLGSYDVNDFEVYVSNDNCIYQKVENTLLSRDTRDGKDVLRLTFDSVECTFVKLYAKGEGISVELENIKDGFCTYSSEETTSFELTGMWYSRGGEGDFYTLSDGTIIMSYIGYGPAGHGDFVDSDILAKMSTDGGKTWSPSWIVLDKQDESVNIMQSRLFWLENDELGILYHEKNAGENRSNLYFRRSYDLGRNWEDPIQITEIYDPYYSIMSSGNCVNRLASGRIIFAASTQEETNDCWGTPHSKVYIWYSDDNGDTWERSDGVVVLPNTTCEPCVAPLPNGDLLMTMRTRKEGKIYQTISTDQGNTWAQPEAVENIVTPSSTNTIVTIPATDDVLLIWNDEFATDNGVRKPLSFAISNDHGLTYKNKKNTIEVAASWPVMVFYGRRAFMQPSSGVKVCDVEEIYYTREGSKTLADLPKAATPNATYENGWLNGVSANMTYSTDGGKTWKFCGGTSVQIGEGYTEIFVKDIGTHEYSPSEVQIIGDGEQPTMLDIASVLNDARLVVGSSHAMYNKTAELEFEVDNIAEGEIILAHGDVTLADNAKVNQSSALKLTGDKLVSQTRLGNNLNTYLDVAHGLDISGKVKVKIEAAYDKAVVTVETENGKFVTDEFSWLGRNGDIFAETNGTAIKNVRFSWNCPDLAKDVWLMGDSMFDSSGLVIPTGWPYFAIEAGNTNGCWFGWGGRKTEQALAEFKNALNYGTPKYAVWCMGANNQDSATAINSTWKNATDEFLIICEEKGITPILATIPNSTRINYYKNQIVKASGYRYIDLNTAVGANDAPETSGWTEGYVYKDGLHPTALGAQAMYNEVIKVVPEIKGD